MELKQFSGVTNRDEFGNFDSQLIFDCYSGSIEEIKSLLHNFRKCKDADGDKCYCLPLDMPKLNCNKQYAVIVLYEDAFDSYYDYPKVSTINVDDISLWLSNFTDNYDVLDFTELDDIDVDDVLEKGEKSL